VSRRGVLAAFASLAVMATACDHLLTKPLMYTSVNVLAERRDGTPIGGAPIELFTGQRPMAYDSTNGAGLALFQFVPAGPAYGLLAEAPAGYAFPELLLGGPPTNVIAGFALSADSAPHFTFRFLRIGPGTVKASVVDQAGKPIAGVDVSLYSPSGTVQHATTTTTGSVTFSAVPFGNYGVSAPVPPPNQCAGGPDTISQAGLLIEQGVTATATLSMPGLCQGNVNLTVASLPCGIELGVLITSSAGWSAAPGRGGSFVDALSVANGTTLNVGFTLARLAP
jgi:hypothetical protein